MVRSVTTKSGALKFEVVDRLAALEKLAKVLGLPLDAAPQTVANTQVNVTHMNVSGNDTALEAVRRLAFALQKAARVHLLPEAAALPSGAWCLSQALKHQASFGYCLTFEDVDLSVPHSIPHLGSAAWARPSKIPPFALPGVGADDLSSGLTGDDNGSGTVPRQ
jgi:hypothetical protein